MIEEHRVFTRNIFPRRPQANSGTGKHTTGTSTSEAKALVSRRAGCHAVVSWARVLSLVARPGRESGRRALRAACGKPGRRLLLPSALIQDPQREAPLPRSPDRGGILRAQVGSGAALRSRSLATLAPAAGQGRPPALSAAARPAPQSRRPFPALCWPSYSPLLQPQV